MRKDAGVDGDAQRISQLVWMLFLKIFEDREKEYETMEEDYLSPLPEKLRWRNWAADPESITGDELSSFVNNELFPSLKDLSLGPEADQRGFVVRNVFEDSYNYMKSGTLMRQVINKINEIDFNTDFRQPFIFQKESNFFASNNLVRYRFSRKIPAENVPFMEHKKSCVPTID